MNTVSVNIDSSVIIALIAFVGTVINTIATADKQSKKDAVAMEHRLTKIESVLELRVVPLWNMIEKTFPKLAEREDTPELDTLLEKYRTAPENMDEDELFELLTGIESELKKISVDEALERGRAVVLAFLSVPVRVRFDEKKRERLCK